MRTSMLLITIPVFFACGAIRADHPVPGKSAGKLSLTTRRVVIFKDGHGLFVKRAEGRSGPDGTVFTDEVPDAASLGSFWVSDRNKDIGYTVASRAERIETSTVESDCTSIFEILSANEGKRASVTTQDGHEHRGIIRRALQTRAANATTPKTTSPVAYLARPHVGASQTGKPPETRVELQSPRGSLFILETEKGALLLTVQAVKSVLVDDMAFAIERNKITTRQVKTLTVHYPDPRPGENHQLDMLYFRPGIRWIPTYRIELLDEDTARIAMQAEILNEAEDFENTPVDFVVGVPTFKFADVVSPLTLERIMVDALAQSAPQLMGQLSGQAMSNAYFHARAGERHGNQVAGATPGIEVAIRAMEGAETQDLFYYSTRKLSLRRGERAVVEVFRARVPYRHVYTWDIGPAGSPANARTTDSPLQLNRNHVWHQIVLTNTTRLPWTTGPAMLMQKGRPLGQDLLTFTPPKREVMVPLTEAVSVRGTVSEQELARKQAAATFNGYRYARIEGRRTFRVTSSLDHPVHLVITAEFAGECSEPGKNGKILYSGQRPGQRHAVPVLNLYAKVQWELTLPARHEHEVSADYHYYVRE